MYKGCSIPAALAVTIGLTACQKAASPPDELATTHAAPGASSSASAAVAPSASSAPVDTTPPGPAVFAAADEDCSTSADHTLFVSPERPAAGQPLRIMGLAEAAPGGGLLVRAPDGSEPALEVSARGGPPFSYYGEIERAEVGTYRIVLHRGQQLLACRDIEIESEPGRKRHQSGGAWPIEREWDLPMENYFSAWVEMLFDAPLDEQPSWKALHFVTRDRARNFLHDHHGRDEDQASPAGLTLKPDCADLPYFLRAYFAYKLRLPYAYSSCTRGGGGKPPRCLRQYDNTEPVESKSSHPVRVFDTFLRVDLRNKVHSGNGRTEAESDETDFYPVPLSNENIRPGMLYADPYGHLLVVAKKIAQRDDGSGVLLAVDAQPDSTVARRRYWRGNFLFSLDYPALGSPGFKRFRPVVRDRGGVRALTNAQITAHPVYGDYSLEQYELGKDGFYDKMDEVLSPNPQDPNKALLAVITALDEQVRRRVLSVNNGEEYLAGGAGTIEMPDGPAIFETIGAWENFSTPARDLRLLIAIDVVKNFPARLARRPERYKIPAGKSATEVASDLDALLKKETESRKFTYERSNGRSQTLSIGEVLERAEVLEMAWNPNDCVEIRWGAAPGSDEHSSCRRHAPAGQRRKMKKYRPWFTERRRPVRR